MEGNRGQKSNWRGGLQSYQIQEDDTMKNNFLEKMSQFCFPNVPMHFPLKKKVMLAKTLTPTGLFWDNFQLFLVVVSCVLMVVDSYTQHSYKDMRTIFGVELAITQVFMIDFALNTYLRSSPWLVFTDASAILDMVTIAPVYLMLIFEDFADDVGFMIYLFRLLRAARLFKVLKRLTGKNKHIVSCALLLLTSSFVVAGSFYHLENLLFRQHSGCNYINAATEWNPSCEEDFLVRTGASCDCTGCSSHYGLYDKLHEPTEVRCNFRTFFESIYFTVVTTTAIGYGDFSAIYTWSRLMVLVFIVGTFVCIPIQLNTLMSFMTSRSPFREPYTLSSQECHIILCGHVNDKSKLEKFFKEFFHPDRLLTSTEEYHAVILGSTEPTEEVRSLLVSPMLDTRVTYVIGSAVAVEDLKRVRADKADTIFFLCNTEVAKSSTSAEDAATVLRALAVANFRPELRSLVQIIKPEDKAILKDSDVDVILCLDEFKTALIARNSICPGFSTFIENLFHSFGNVSTELENSMDPWYSEYLHGARKEIYFAPMSEMFLEVMNYNVASIAEAFFLQFNVIFFGVCSVADQDIVLNPMYKDIQINGKPASHRDFLLKYNVAVIIADDQLETDDISRTLSNPDDVQMIFQKLEDEENKFSIKHLNKKDGNVKSVRERGKLKFLARNVIAPFKRASFKAKSRFSKASPVKSESKPFDKAEVAGSPSNLQKNEDDEPSSDDQTEENYIGLKMTRQNSELPVISSNSGKGTMMRAIINHARNRDPLAPAAVAQHSDPPAPTAVNASIPLQATPPQPAPPIQVAPVQEPAGYAQSLSPAIHKPNQYDDLLSRTPSNDQVLKALKRHSEPPPELERKESEKHQVIKRKSEPPLSTTPSVKIGLTSEDDLVNSPIREKPMAGPPLSLAMSLENLRTTSNRLPPLSSFAEDQSELTMHEEKDEIEKPNDRGSCKKRSSRKSGKFKRIKDQYRKNVVVVTATNSDIEAPMATSGKGDSVKSFERLVSDISNVSSNDNFEKLKNITAPSTVETNDAVIGWKGFSSAENKTGPGSHDHSKGDSIKSFESLKSLGPMQQSSTVYAKTVEEPSRANDAAVTQNNSTHDADVTPAPKKSQKVESSKETRSLSARYSKMGNIVGTLMTVGKTIKKWTEVFGKVSDEITSAANLKRHIIVYGAESSLMLLYISELRRPAIRRLDYHPIVIVSKEEPANWNIIKDRFNDVYFLRGALTKTSVFNRLNIQSAFSLVLFASTTGTAGHAESMGTPDAEALFTYLKLQPYVPSGVFFFVELKNATNVTVLNATIMRRMREFKEVSKSADLSDEHAGGIHKKGTMISLSHKTPYPMLASLSSKYFGSMSPGPPHSSKNETGSIKEISRKIDILADKRSERMFWDAMDTHHILPVFAAGRAFVPVSFETLLVQSFYSTMTPFICDKLVCGQRGQAVTQAMIPQIFAKGMFKDLFRFLTQFQIICFGLYRRPSSESMSILPFVFVCPPPTTVIRKGDCMMLYCTSSHLNRALTTAERLEREKQK